MRCYGSALLGLVLSLFIAQIGCAQDRVVEARHDVALASTSSTKAVASSSAHAAAAQTASAPIPMQVRSPLGALMELPDMVEQVLPSVVGISTKRTVRMQNPHNMFPFDNHPFFRDFSPFFNPGAPREREQQGMGSGVVISADGLILTNNHVIDGADEIRVSLYDKRNFEAEVLGTDPKTDLAVLKLTSPPDDLRPLGFGDSEAIRLGEPVVAIGNPFGLSSTVTMGIISAKGRADIGIVDYEDFIQTDAAINPGNSGGALVNLKGQLVGINTAILSRSGGYQGVGFAIPSNMAQNVMNSLLSDGKVIRGWLGVSIQTLTPELAEALQLSASDRGVIISDVQDDSPAQNAGLQRGDLIVRLGNKSIENATQLRNFVALTAPGTTTSVDIKRNGKRKKLSVQLGELPVPGNPRSQAPAAPSEAIEGLVLGSLNDQLRAQYNLPRSVRQGVVALEVKPGTPAAKSGLQPGDVVLEVNRQAVNSPADFAQAYSNANRRVLMLVWRNNATVFLVVPKHN